MATRQGILGRKVGMTQIFTDTGEVVPVTVIEAGPCTVTQLKTERTDGYNAVQMGFGRVRRLNKPERGHLKDRPPLRVLRELRTDDVDQYSLGQTIDVSLFAVGDVVDVTGTSKGRGFAGVVKRHHFAGGPKTHGQSDRQRAGLSAPPTPGRVTRPARPRTDGQRAGDDAEPPGRAGGSREEPPGGAPVPAPRRPRVHQKATKTRGTQEEQPGRIGDGLLLRRRPWRHDCRRNDDASSSAQHGR